MGCSQSSSNQASAPDEVPSSDIRASESESTDTFDTSPTATAPGRSFERMKSSNSFRNSKNSPVFTKPRAVMGKDNQILQFIHQISGDHSSDLLYIHLQSLLGTITSEPVSKLTTPKFQRRSFSEEDSSAAITALDEPADSIHISRSQPSLHSDEQIVTIEERPASAPKNMTCTPAPQPQSETLPNKQPEKQEVQSVEQEVAEHDSYFHHDSFSDTNTQQLENITSAAAPDSTIDQSSQTLSGGSFSVPPRVPSSPSKSSAVGLLLDDRNVSPSTRKLNQDTTPPTTTPTDITITDATILDVTITGGSAAADTLATNPPESEQPESIVSHDAAEEPTIERIESEPSIEVPARIPTPMEAELPSISEHEETSDAVSLPPPRESISSAKSSPIISQTNTKSAASPTPGASPSPTNSDKQVKRRKSRNPVRQLSSASVLSNASGVSESSRLTDGTEEGGAPFMVFSNIVICCIIFLA